MPKSEKDTDNLNLIRTKLFIPKVRENLIPRPDLFERLDVASLGKLTLVSAPAGYGKTTLVSAWAQQTKQLVTWLSLDENDNDFTRFWSYFIYAVRRINEGVGGDILIGLQSAQIPQMDALLTMLINELSGMEG